MDYEEYVENQRVESLNYQKALALSIQNLTDSQRSWIRSVLNDEDNSNSLDIAPSYLYRVKTQNERNSNKEVVKDKLEMLRREMKKFSPEELLKLKYNNQRIIQGVENFVGIYIIYNSTKDMYYIGQSIRVVDRVMQHFLNDQKRVNHNLYDGLPVIYNDFKSGNEFSISLIPLDETSFSTLNELEDNAIRAYKSLAPNGYNRNSGNLLVKAHFKNDDYREVANLLLENIKETNLFLSLTNNKKRHQYTRILFLELALSYNLNFLLSFVDFIRVYRKETKKRP